MNRGTDIEDDDGDARFCSWCGAELVGGRQYCASCGRSAKGSPPDPWWRRASARISRAGQAALGLAFLLVCVGLPLLDAIDPVLSSALYRVGWGGDCAGDEEWLEAMGQRNDRLDELQALVAKSQDKPQDKEQIRSWGLEARQLARAQETSNPPEAGEEFNRLIVQGFDTVAQVFMAIADGEEAEALRLWEETERIADQQRSAGNRLADRCGGGRPSTSVQPTTIPLPSLTPVGSYIAMTVDDVERRKEVGQGPPRESAQNQYVIVFLVIMNISQAPKSVALPDLFLTDSEGNRYLWDPAATGVVLGETFGLQAAEYLDEDDVRLQAKGIAEVALVFDVPSTAADLAVNLPGAAPAELNAD